ncbi:unnamed protein product, partial [marine sediment metagenome]
MEDQYLINTIYKKKDEKFKNTYEKYKLYKITSKKVDQVLEKFLNRRSPVIKPNLINTFLVREIVKDHLELLLIDSHKNHTLIKKIKVYFPFSIIVRTKDIFSDKLFFYVELRTPDLTSKEKLQLISILYNNFKEKLLFGNWYFWYGLLEALSIKNFYDFELKDFF